MVKTLTIRRSAPTGPIIAASDKEMPHIARKAFAALSALTDGVSITGIMQAWVEGGEQAALQYIRLERLEKSMAGLVNTAFDIGFHVAKDNLRHLLGIQKAELPDAVEFNMRFDSRNMLAEAFLAETSFALIQSITNTTRESIRNVILTAFREGGNPRLQAREIRDSIGLTPRHVLAVQNFRRQLMEQTNTPGGRGMQRVDARRLLEADRRLAARHIRTGMLSQARIDELVGKYRGRLLLYRAEMIARTETSRAAHAGQQALWMQAMDEGLLPPTARRKWIFTKDERTRNTHKAIASMNPEGVGLNESFKTPFGPVFRPPAEPNCRCTVVLDPRAGRAPITGATSPSLSLKPFVAPVIHEAPLRRPNVVGDVLTAAVITAAIAEEVGEMEATIETF